MRVLGRPLRWNNLIGEVPKIYEIASYGEGTSEKRVLLLPKMVAKNGPWDPRLTAIYVPLKK